MLSTHLKLKYFGLTDIGLVREHNEDAWKADPEKGLFILADGMGGHQAGEIAAQHTVEKLSEIIHGALSEGSSEFVREAIKQVNILIYKQGQENESLLGMGTTVCCLLLSESHVIFAHVGDSRIYRFRHNTLQLLTKDHSLINDLLDMQVMQPEEVSSFPYRHILTKAIGTNSLVEPTVNEDFLESGDLFLLCSDGLTNLVSDSEIKKILKEESSLEKKGKALIDLAKNHGGSDNITALLIKIEKN